MNGLSPDQLRAVAQKLHDRYWRPDPTMRPGQYVSHEAVNALADALDELAMESESDD